MPSSSEPLKNIRHERFCLALAEGMSQAGAYQHAGFKETASARANAARLIAKDSIRNRLAYLQAQMARSTEITIESICAELDQAVEVAKANKQGNALVNAATLRAKLGGLLTPTTKVEVSIEDQRVRGELERAWPNLTRVCEVMLREIYPEVEASPELLEAFVKLHMRHSDEMDELVASFAAKPVEQLAIHQERLRLTNGSRKR